MGESEVQAFLVHLAQDRQLAPSTLAQALAALLFLYKEVLRRPISGLGAIPRARAPVRLPVVLTAEEVRSVLEQMRGVTRLVALLLYGSGMRLMECLTLRVKDLDIARGEILIRRGKGAKDRVTVLPEILRPAMASQIAAVRDRHARDCDAGVGAAGERGGWVALPGALWIASTRRRVAPSSGTGSFRRAASMWMPDPAGGTATTCTSPPCIGR